MTKPSSSTTRWCLLAWVIPLGVSALAWIVLLISLPPERQDFPLNDDWAFARGAMQFARGEGIHYGGWASMPQLGQWVWAYPFLWLLGESFFALRLSTVVLSWFGLWAFRDLLRRQGLTSSRASLATTVLALNPLFFLLQGTFMTDVPALSLALLGLNLYRRAFGSGQLVWLAGAACVATLAAVTRQNTLAVAAVSAIQLWRDPRRSKPIWWLAVLLPVAAGLATHFWFQARSDVRVLQAGLLPMPDLLLLPFLLVHFCGLAILPLLALRPRRSDFWRTGGAVFAVLAVGAGCLLAYDKHLPYGGLFPYSENMISPQGAFAGSRFTGPFIVGERPVLLGTTARALLSLLGCIGGAELAARAVQYRRRKSFDPVVLFTLCQVPFLLIVHDLYDRYFLFLLPGAIAIAMPSPTDLTEKESRGSLLVSWGMALFVGLCSLGLMHDWLTWNCARWELGRRALARDISPEAIEGGVEWNGWFVGLPEHANPPPAQRRWRVLPFTQEWFPSVVGRFALSFSAKPDGLGVRYARTLDTQPYTLWLRPGRREFYLIETPAVSSGTAAPPSQPP